MSPGVLSRLFAAQQGPQQGGQEPHWGPNPYPQQDYGVPGQQMAMAPHHMPQAQQPLTLEQEPADLWGGQGGGNIDLGDPNLGGDPGAMESRMASVQGSAPWPDDSYFYDRNEDNNMGVLMDTDQSTMNIPQGALGDYQPGDMVPGSQMGPWNGPTHVMQPSPMQQGPQITDVPGQGGPLQQMFGSPAMGGRMTSR